MLGLIAPHSLWHFARAAVGAGTGEVFPTCFAPPPSSGHRAVCAQTELERARAVGFARVNGSGDPGLTVYDTRLATTVGLREEVSGLPFRTLCCNRREAGGRSHPALTRSASLSSPSCLAFRKLYWATRRPLVTCGSSKGHFELRCAGSVHTPDREDVA